VKKTKTDDGKDSISITLDKDKIWTVGKQAMHKFLIVKTNKPPIHSLFFHLESLFPFFSFINFEYFLLFSSLGIASLQEHR